MTTSLTPSATTSAATPDVSVPWRERLIYGFGGIADRIGNNNLKDLGNPIFNLVLGINPALVGMVFVITRLFDAFFDPVVGNWSDNTRGRWGRRRPFLLVGGVLSAIAVVPIFWMPEGMGGSLRLGWMITTALVFYAAFTVFSVPYRAIAYELSPGYHQKTQLIGMRTLFGMFGSLGVPWVFPLVQSGYLGTPLQSIPWVAAGLGLLILVSALVPAFFVREPDAVAHIRQRPIPLRESLGRTLRCRPFRLLVGMGAGTVIGMNVGFGFGSYVTIYHVYGGDAKAAAPLLGWAGTVFVLVSLVSVSLTIPLSRLIGKRATQLLLLAWAFLGSVGSWWLFNPAHPWVQLLLPVFLGPGSVGLWMFGESMVADVCAADARVTGERNEAVFSAFFGWILKSATALSILASNVLLNVTGFHVADGPLQSAGTVLGMRCIYAGFTSAGFLVSIWFLWNYRLDQEAAPQG